MAQVRSD